MKTMELEIKRFPPREKLPELSRRFVDKGFYSFQEKTRSEPFFPMVKEISKVSDLKVFPYEYDFLFGKEILLFAEQVEKDTVNLAAIGDKGRFKGLQQLLKDLYGETISITVEPRAKHKLDKINTRVRRQSPMGQFIENETEKALIFQDSSVKNIYAFLKEWKRPLPTGDKQLKNYIEEVKMFSGLRLSEAKTIQIIQSLEQNSFLCRKPFVFCKKCKAPVAQIEGKLSKDSRLGCPTCGIELTEDDIENFSILSSKYKHVRPNVWLEAAVYQNIRKYGCASCHAGLKIDGQDIDVLAIIRGGKSIFCECKDTAIGQDDIGRALMRSRMFEELLDYYFLITSRPVTVKLDMIPEDQRDKVRIIEASSPDKTQEDLKQNLSEIENKIVSEMVKEKFFPFIYLFVGRRLPFQDYTGFLLRSLREF